MPSFARSTILHRVGKDADEPTATAYESIIWRSSSIVKIAQENIPLAPLRQLTDSCEFEVSLIEVRSVSLRGASPLSDRFLFPPELFRVRFAIYAPWFERQPGTLRYLTMLRNQLSQL